MKTLLPLLLLAFSGALRAQSGELWLSGGASILDNRNIGSPFSDGQSSDVRLGDGFQIGARSLSTPQATSGMKSSTRTTGQTLWM